MKPREVVRMVLGSIYLFGAAVNLWFTLFNPQVYHGFADSAITAYKTLWDSVVIPNLTSWLVLVIIFEITVGTLILSKGNFVKIGLVCSIVFNTFLIPFWWFGWSLINLFLVLVQLPLLRGEYGSSVIQILGCRRR